MAQATNPRIEELRFRVKTDPKSRLFLQLAEELRKAGQFGEAEHVLRAGLAAYPTYLSAWVTLGRVLRANANDRGAVEALNHALQLDPGNVVAARLLADAYLALGEQVEAIKKYKLVQALMPGDDEVQAAVQQLERDLNPIAVSAPDEPLEERGSRAEAPSAEESVFEEAATASEPAVFKETASEERVFEEEQVFGDEGAETSVVGVEELPFAEAARALEQEHSIEQATGDDEPMSAAHEESPFEEPVDTFTMSTLEIEEPQGMHVGAAPLAAEVPAPPPTLEDLPEVDEPPVFDVAAEVPPAQPDAVGSTMTMADLYVRQGLVDDARRMYEDILARDPENAAVREKLEALSPQSDRRVERLERWLSKVVRREVGSV